MKLRCTHNSIRIRVRKSELEILAKEGQLVESILFAPQLSAFSFCLIIEDHSKHPYLTAAMKDQQLTIEIPKLAAEKWLTTDLVGIENEYIVDEENRLHILLEKDFPCKDREDEDKSDFFETLSQQQERNQC